MSDFIQIAGRDLDVQWNSTVAPTGITILRVMEGNDPDGASPPRPPATPLGFLLPEDDEDDDDIDDDEDDDECLEEKDDDEEKDEWEEEEEEEEDGIDDSPRGARCPLSAA